MVQFPRLGAEAALTALGLEKCAWAWLANAATKLAPTLAPKVMAAAKPYTAGVGKEMGRQTLIGAGLGGALGGGLGAAFAPEGQRWDAFGRGAVQGAGMGAIGGAAMGAGSTLMGNTAKQIGSKSLMRATPGMSAETAQTAMSEAMKGGIRGNYRALRAAGTDPAARRLAGAGMLGSLAQEAGGWGSALALPATMGGFGVLDKSATMLPSRMYLPPENSLPTSEGSELLPPGTLGGATGGTLGVLAAAIPMLIGRTRIPRGLRPWYLEDVAARAIPSVTGAGGMLAGTAIENKLRQSTLTAPPSNNSEL